MFVYTFLLGHKLSACMYFFSNFLDPFIFSVNTNILGVNIEDQDSLLI